MNKKYVLALIVTALAVFALNSNHLNQLMIFYNHFLPLAKSILSGHGYSYMENIQASYPLWGYPVLLLPGAALGVPELFALAMQFGFMVAAVYYFYKLFDLKAEYWHLFVLIPFIALMSVKWADAVIGAMIIPYFYYIKRYTQTGRAGFVFVAGLVLGIGANFRSEYLFLPLAQFLFSCFTGKSNIGKSLKLNIGILGIVLVCLLPWAIRSWINSGEFRFTATNGGAVSYISLGQLPNNAWGIKAVDSTSHAIAKYRGIADPYSEKGDSLFQELTREKIKQNPAEFAKKMAYNGLQILTRGVYTGEYGNAFMSTDYRLKLNYELQYNGGAVKQLIALASYPISVSAPIFIEKVVQFVFMPLTFVFLLYFLGGFFVKNIRKDLMYSVLMGYVAYRIAVMCAVQYEYRHVNSIYLIILGVFLTNIPKIKEMLLRVLKKK